MRNILIIDDELIQAKFFGKCVNHMDHNAIYLEKGQDAVDFFVDKLTIDGVHSSEVDVVLLDIALQDIDGLEVLRRINKSKGETQVIIVTSDTEVTTIAKATHLGAFDYIVKGGKDILPRITTSVANALAKKDLHSRISFEERMDDSQITFADLVGVSKPFLTAVDLSKKACNSTASFLIEGQMGTGKEFLARVIHGSSPRAGMPFVSVDCSKLTMENANNVLFGYKKILASGKEDKSSGKIVKASGGTLFLNNIDSLPIDTQIQLLNFIQDGEVTTPSGKLTSGLNIRICAATTRNLLLLSQKGRFKEDLYYCLGVFIIQLPSLRERGHDDIRALSNSFCSTFNSNENKRIKGISDEAWAVLLARNWEGNVRQLRSCIFRAVILCEDQQLEVQHFPQISKFTEDLDYEYHNRANAESLDYDGKSIRLFDYEGKCKSWAGIGQEIVQQLFEIYNGNLSEMSKNLKISRSTIYRKLNLEE